MTKHQFALRRSSDERRQFRRQRSSGRTKSMAEVAGGTTAEVAAVACCLPCFSVVTMYQVPAGMYRNAMRRRRRRLMMPRNDNNNNEGGKRCKIEDELSMHPAVVAAAERFLTPEVDKDMLAFEDEMWEKFSDRGFFRGSSEN